MSNVNPEEVFLTVPSPFYLGPKLDTINIRQGIFVVATIGDLTVTTINGIPLPGGIFVTTTAVQTLSNKSLVDANTTFINSVDNTKQMRFSLTGATGGTLTQININSVAARTYSIPDSGANANFVMTEGNQSINGVKTFLVEFSQPRVDVAAHAGNVQVRAQIGEHRGAAPARCADPRAERQDFEREIAGLGRRDVQIVQNERVARVFADGNRG